MRARQRRAEREQQQNRPNENQSAASVVASSTTSASLLSADDDDNLEWPQDAGMDVPESSDFLLQNQVSLGGSFDLPSMNFGMDTLFEPPPASPATQPATSRTPATPATQSSSFAPARLPDISDSQFIIEGARFVVDYENYIMLNLKSFKMVLGLVRSGLDTVARLSDTPQAALKMRCAILLTLIMYQVVQLLEICPNMLSEDTNQQRNQPFSRQSLGNSLLPGLGLGNYGFDEEEDNAWKCQQVLKGINQANEALRKLRRLALKGTDESQSSHGRSSGECFVDLELKLNELAGRIARRR